jgi:hypothetical protein
MRLFSLRRRTGPLTVAVTTPDDPRCSAVAVSSGKRCKLPAGPDGFCGVFHRSVLGNGPRAA